MKFLDGPAKGVVLDLQRAPLLLRVVIDRDEPFTDYRSPPADTLSAARAIKTRKLALPRERAKRGGELFQEAMRADG